MLDLKEWIAKITAYTKDTYIVDTFNASYSFSSQRYKEVTKDISKTGYTPIGIVGWKFSGVDWYTSRMYISGTTAYLYVFRTSSTTATGNVDIHVLYSKNS